MTSIDLTVIDPYALDDESSEPGSDWHKRRRKLALERRIARAFRKRRRRLRRREAHRS